ncbi:MAG: YitT family protein [Eubacteriales bacterium]|nr:YitT family protein [Eubacteriales bacterium]
MNLFIKNKLLFKQYLLCCFGAFLYAASFNLFIIPHHLFSAGFFGTAQLIQYFMNKVLGLNLGIESISIIYWLLNLPLFFLMYKAMNKQFFTKTILVITLTSIALLIIPTPKELVVHDRLTAVIAGAIIGGVGLGLILRSAASSGGLDIVGVIIAKTSKTFSVGKIGLMYNAVIYSISGLLFGIETMIYSTIYTVITSMIIDRSHYQNICISSLVFTKVPGMSEHIMKELNRGSTLWKGLGAYTKEESDIILTIISKYEKRLLTRIVQAHDPNAFIIYTDNTDVRGNFVKRLDK